MRYDYDVCVEQFTGDALTGEEPGWYAYTRTAHGIMRLWPGEWRTEDEAREFADDLRQLRGSTIAVLVGDA